jgi:hypothetical protein
MREPLPAARRMAAVRDMGWGYVRIMKEEGRVKNEMRGKRTPEAATIS